MPNTTTVQLVGVGGQKPYTFQVVSSGGGGTTTITASITGVNSDQLLVDASAKQPGFYTVVVKIIDGASNIAYKIVSVKVLDPSIFSILNENATYEPNSFPAATSILLSQNGGTGTIVWSLIPTVTTLPGVTITGGNTLSFNLTQFGTWTVGVRAIDSLQNVVTKVITVSVASAVVYQLVDGQLEVKIDAPNTKVGTHSFSAVITDATSATITKQFTYQVLSAISDIRIQQAVFDNYWGLNDVTRITFPVLGDFSGFSLGPSTIPIASNGLVATVDPTTNTVSVSGPPTSFRNAEITIPLSIQQGTTSVATVSRQFTLISHNGTTDVGNLACFTRPYLVGDFVSLNPQKPFFNSPSIFKNAAYKVRVQTGSTLPNGLSLDENTGLIYGPVQDANTASSIVEFYDSSNLIHATINITWDIKASQFALIESLPVAQIQQTYNSEITSSSTVPLTAATAYRGRLPAGLGFSIDSGTNSVVISGNPTEAGYFDIWIQATNSSAQVAYIYKRFVVDYISPLVILTDTLQTVTTNIAYTQQLVGFGGVQPYVWSIIAGTLPSGITLNSSSGELSGTTSVGSYDQNLTFQLQDARGVTATAVLELKINNTLRILTPVLPNVVPGQNYSIALQGAGGTPPYTNWAINSGTLPTGISLNSSTGVISGVTTDGSVNETLVIQVTDSAAGTATKSFNLITGAASGMIIDTAGIGAVIRGGPYQGQLRATGTFTAPVSWQIAADTPNALPAGLTLNGGDASNNGVTATVSGATTAVLTNYSVKVQAVDANGQSSLAFMILNSVSGLAVATNALPTGVLNVAYTFTLTANGFNPPFTWTLDGSSPALPSGFSLSSSGVLSGTDISTVYNQHIVVKVTDVLGDTATKSLQLIIQSSSLAIATATIPSITAGHVYTFTLTATGGTPGYTWAVSPASVNTLPAGISLDPATGILSGSSNAVGYSKVITFRVTDSLGGFTDKALNVTVSSGLTLFTGIDYTDTLSTNYLGYVDSGDVSTLNPAPNKSFVVIATGVLATSPAQLQVSVTNSNITATVQSIVSGVATITLSGTGFDNGAAGDNILNISVTDQGVTVSAAFKWKVYDDGVLRIAPASGSFPTLIIT